MSTADLVRLTEAARRAEAAAERLGTCRELLVDLMAGINHGQVFALDLAGDLNTSHGLALTRDLGGIINNAYALEQELVVACGLAHRLTRGMRRGRAVADALDEARADARMIAKDLAVARERDRAHRRLPHALWYDSILPNAEAYAEARDKACFMARELAGHLTAAMAAAVALANDLGVAGDLAEMASESAKRTGASPARPAVRVAWTAAGLLARHDRLTYDLEYRSELADLAASGVSRWQQLQHSARLLARAPLLRAELASARRRQAVP